MSGEYVREGNVQGEMSCARSGYSRIASDINVKNSTSLIFEPTE